MKLTPSTQPMNLPSYIKFGCELEVENVNDEKIKKEITSNNLNGWKVKKDYSLVDEGAEIVSPPLSESENPHMYEDFQKVCNIINSNPKDTSRKVYTDHTCGGHIHLDASILESNPEMLENFLRLWAESESIFYKICNGKNDPVRDSAISFNLGENVKDLFVALPIELYKNTKKTKENISSQSKDKLEAKKIIRGYISATKRGVSKSFTSAMGLLSRIMGMAPKKQGYAYPTSSAIKKLVASKKDLVKGIKKPIINKYKKVKLTGSKIKSQNIKKIMKNHYSGINLGNISADISLFHQFSSRLEGKKEKNTYEHRMHNGSTDFNVWKQNMFLDASFLKTVYQMTYEPEKVDKKLSAFYEKDISEEEKLNRFLDLTMDYPEDREIYKQRYESVKNAPVFGKDFQKNCAVTFKKEDLKDIANTIGISSINKTINKLFSRAKESIRALKNNNENELERT